jgi:hypothetical protein
LSPARMDAPRRPQAQIRCFFLCLRRAGSQFQNSLSSRRALGNGAAKEISSTVPIRNDGHPKTEVRYDH